MCERMSGGRRIWFGAAVLVSLVMPLLGIAVVATGAQAVGHSGGEVRRVLIGAGLVLVGLGLATLYAWSVGRQVRRARGRLSPGLLRVVAGWGLVGAAVIASGIVHALASAAGWSESITRILAATGMGLILAAGVRGFVRNQR